jgi:FkbM family methyltransferase
MKALLRQLLRRNDYALLNLRLEQSTGVLLPGHVAKIVSSCDVNCVLDVGANGGHYGEMLRRYGYAGRIVSFEPASPAFRLLEQRASGDDAWHVRNWALGSRDEERTFQVAEAHWMSSFLPQRALCTTLGENSAIVASEQVMMHRLDTVFRESVAGIEQPRVFLKVDTQGYDLEVLRGATASLSHVVALQTELSLQPLYEGSPHYLDSLGFLESFGFHVTGLFDVVKDPRSNHIVEIDAILTRG